MAYLPHCAAMLHSVFAHRQGQQCQVHFLHGPELPVAELQPLAEMVERLGGTFVAHFIPAAWVEGLPRLSQIPAVMWYRVYLPQLLPAQTRVLYLDCDTVVMDDLASLWQTPLDGLYLAAVANVLEERVKDWPQALGLPPQAFYFNSGVLLFNLDQMRTDGMTEKLVAFGREQAARLRWPDQDALNAVLGRQCQFVHPRWNCQNSLFYYPRSREVFGAAQVREAIRQPGIVHFEGGNIVKPWHYLSKHPYRRAYLEHRRQTPWPQVEFQDRTVFNALLRLLPTSWAFVVRKYAYRLLYKVQALTHTARRDL